MIKLKSFFIEIVRRCLFLKSSVFFLFFAWNNLFSQEFKVWDLDSLELKSGRVLCYEKRGDGIVMGSLFYYVSQEGDTISLNNDVDGVNVLLGDESNSKGESLAFLQKNMMRILKCSFGSGYFHDNYVFATNDHLKSMNLDRLYDRYIYRDKISYESFYSKINETSKSEGFIIDEQENSWQFSLYVQNARGSLELWNASGFIYPLKLISFSKEKIVLPDPFLRNPILF